MTTLAHAILIGCIGGLPFTCCTKPPPDEPPTRRLDVAFPYHAGPQRRDRIISNRDDVEAGMTAERVRAVLGEPDAILPVYTGPSDRPRTGWTYLYLVRQLERSGSVPSRREVSLSVHFGNDWTVRGVETTGEFPPAAGTD